MSEFGYEVITTDDKAKRNAMFDQLRKSDKDNERQVVKFSDCRTNKLDSQGRTQYTSTWSVAYPRD